jgi:hypothetical protein
LRDMISACRLLNTVSGPQHSCCSRLGARFVFRSQLRQGCLSALRTRQGPPTPHQASRTQGVGSVAPYASASDSRVALIQGKYAYLAFGISATPTIQQLARSSQFAELFRRGVSKGSINEDGAVFPLRYETALHNGLSIFLVCFSVQEHLGVSGSSLCVSCWSGRHTALSLPAGNPNRLRLFNSFNTCTEGDFRC